MRALVIGASGQLGRALYTGFAATHSVVAAGHEHVEHGQRQVDLGDAASLRRLLDDVDAQLLLVAGAMCNVDRCELEPAICHRVNVTGTQIIAEHARTIGATVVFFSTDHVFDGSKEIFREADAVAPLNVYAASKADAEALLRQLLPDHHLIIRTSSVYGFDLYRRNFVLRLIDRVSQGRPVTVPEDQWGSPTCTEDLARAVRVLVERGETGTFHATGPECVSRVSFATRICAGFELDPTLIVPRPTRSLGQAARRPLKVRLDCRKLGEAGVEPFRTIDAGLKSLLAWLRSSTECQ